MTFPFVVMHGPFLFCTLAGRGWICGEWFIKDLTVEKLQNTLLMIYSHIKIMTAAEN